MPFITNSLETILGASTPANLCIFKTSTGWQGESNFILSDTHMLKITTSKLGSGGLCARATVGEVKDGFFTYMMYADFYKKLVVSNERCTERNVTCVHGRALGQLEWLLTEIEMFYSKK